MSEDRPTSSRGGKWFSTTQWSLVLAAGDSANVDSRDALATLCTIYWRPVYSYIRCRGPDADSACDLAQGFFTRLLEKKDLKDARRERGKFRSFLLASVKHYLANEWDRDRALKRGGGKTPIPLDIELGESIYRIEPVDEETPETIYERRWALTLLEHVLVRLADEAERSGDPQRFRRFRPYLTAGGRGAPYKQLSGELGMSESAVKVAIHRLRRRFG